MSSVTLNRLPASWANSFCLIAAVILLGACASGVRYYDRIEPARFHSEFQFTIPAGWVVIQHVHDRLVLTRDGVEIQAFAVARRPLKKAFRVLERDASLEMSMEELSALYEAEVRQNAGARSFEVLQSQPVEMAAKSGFQLDFVIKNERGLRWQNRVYGQVREDGLYLIRYQAPLLHYFQRDLKTFENFVDSFREI